MIGQAILEYIVEAGLVWSDHPEGVVLIWSANATEQIGQKAVEECRN